MTEKKQCSKCKSIEAIEHFEKEGGAEYFKTCIVWRMFRQYDYDNHKDDLKRKRGEERACN